VMLHTGTMFAVILYFWKTWKANLFPSWAVFKSQAVKLIVATLFTGAIGYPLIKGIEICAEKMGCVAKDATGHLPKAEVELLFGNLALVGTALTAAGALILTAGLVERHRDKPVETKENAPIGSLTAGNALTLTAGRAKAKRKKKVRDGSIGFLEAICMGAVQGLCLPFRGFSRSGATISTGMLLGAVKSRVEEFSFALAVIITPAAIGREVMRLTKAQDATGGAGISLAMFAPSLLGMVFAFFAGLLALVWLSRWLEHGRWYLFGVYCLVAAVVVFALNAHGY
jgi:undecaprenyl-diphosphatase